MKTKQVIVTDIHGEEVTAELMVCPKCESSWFLIMNILNHTHLQCAECGTSYCDRQGEGCNATEPEKSEQ